MIVLLQHQRGANTQSSTTEKLFKAAFVQDVTDFSIYTIFILKIFKFNIKQFDKNIVLSYNTFNVILKLVHLMKGKSSLLRQVPENRWLVKTGDGGQRKILPEDRR